MTGNLQMGKKKITDLGDGSSSKDAVNYSQLIDPTRDHSRDYQLAPSFKFYRDFGDKAALTKSSLVINNHQHLDLYDVGGIETRTTDFQGFASSNIKMTNNLKRGIYTAVFELFCSYNNILNNETLLQNLRVDSHYKVLNYSHYWESDSGGNTPHSKAFIQFSTDGSPGEIKFEIQYYGSHYNQSGIDLLFYSRVLQGKHNDTYDHRLFDVKESEYGGEFLFFEDLNINNKKIINLAEPKKDGDAANKKYVDSKATNVDLTAYLKRDGSQSMTGNLQMCDHTITGIRSSSQDNAALTVGGAKSIYLPLNGSRGMESSLNMGNNTIRNLKMPPNNPSSGNPPDDCALNFKYFHSQRGDLERQINEVGSKAFSKNGSDPMEAKLDMNLFDIINLPTADSNESSYAANVNYVNKTVSDNNASIDGLIDSKVAEVEALNIKASKRENVFSFVMDNDLFKEDDDDITKVGKVEKDFYDINQASYEFTIDYDSKIGYYSTRLTIDLKALDIGEFTLVFEMYYDSSKIDKDEVVVDTLSGSLNVSRHNTNKFSDYSRTIINFHKYGFLGLNDLDIDITLKNKSRINYDPAATIFVVVYGVSGHQNDVDIRIWDRIYYVQKQNVKFEAAIDMNDHDIINVDNLSMNNFINMNDNQVKNLQDGNENGDAVNIKQLNENESNLVKFINRKITEVKNEIATATKGVYFYTRNPVYDSYSVKLIQKKIKWSSISNYQWSGSNDFTLNSDTITIRQSETHILNY